MNYWTSTSNSGDRKKKLPQKKKNDKKERSVSEKLDPNSTCQFCATTKAAVCVMLPIVGRLTKRQPTPYCLKCYYSTSAVRQDSTRHVSVLNQGQLENQLPAIQSMFSEAFLELQQEISNEAELAFQRRRNSSADPLAALMTMGGTSNKSKKRRTSAGATTNTSTNRVGRAGKADDGGFLRDTHVPERLLKTQQHQQQIQQQRLDRINRASAAGSGPGLASTGNGSMEQQLSKRRKGSRKSIWNLAMESTTNNGTGKEDSLTMTRKKPPPSSSSTTYDDHDDDHGVVCSSCHSGDVHSFGNITSRNADVRKGEIWGSGSRGDGDVINRYQCNACGKTWNEEE